MKYVSNIFPFTFKMKRNVKLLLALLICHILISSIYIHYQDVTLDEQPYYGYTVRWAHREMARQYEWDDSKSPATFPALIPRTLNQAFYPSYKATDNGVHDLLMGRYCMCLYTIIAACYLFAWCRRLFGNNGWLFPLLFFLFNPLVLGYSMLVLSDMATGACMVAILYHAWSFYEKRNLKQFIFFTAWLGWGIVVKASFIFMVPCLLLLLTVLIASGWLSFNLKKFTLYSGLAVLIISLIINLSYFGIDTFEPFSTYQFRSNQFAQLAEKYNFLKGWFVPVPRALIEGWDLLQFHKELGPGKHLSTTGGVYMLGKTHLQGPVWYYYLVTASIKFPIAILLLLFAAAVSGVMSFNSRRFFSIHIFYVLPLLFFLIILSCFNPFQSGNRHLLLIYPLLIVSIAGSISFWKKKWKKTNMVVLILFISMLVSQLYYFPNLIPYTNELLANKKNVYKITIDSNLDYGQYNRYGNIFLKDHPNFQKAPLTPEAGKFILAIHDVFEARPADLNAYDWILTLQPKDQFKFCFLLYEVTDKDLLKIKK